MSDQVKVKATEYAPGVKSSMRYIALTGVFMSAVTLVAGLVLLILEVMMNKGSAHGLALVGSGLGLYTSGAIAKAWQAQAESRSEVAEAQASDSTVQPPA
jgi:hypothetical protein